MATKKCPKCGEENPAEAVMCWACYTPLAGGAAAAAAGGLVAPRGGAAAVAPAASATEEKTAVDPKIFLVVGLLAVAGVIGAFTTGIFGGSDEDEPPDVAQSNSVSTTPTIVPAAAAPPGPAISVTVGSNNGSTTTALPPVERHYRVMVAPDPLSPVGTMGIVSTDPNISVVQAGGLAKFARNQFAPNGKWSSWQIVVFSDRNTARTFQRYQLRRRNAFLSTGDYQQLANSGLWSGVPAYYVSDAKAERVYQPSKSPSNWWAGGTR